MHNPFKGETPFPLAGEGVVLRFKTGDITRLRGKYGAPPNRKPEVDDNGQLVDHFWTILLTGLASHDPVIMVDVLKAGLKKEDGKTEHKLDWDDLDFTFADMEEPLTDGLTLSRWGRTAADLAVELRAQAEAYEQAAKEGDTPENPTTDPIQTSPPISESSVPDIGPDSL